MTERGAPAKADERAKEAARAYLSAPRDQALAKHPQLSAAYSVEDRLKSVAQEAKPLSPAVQLKVDGTIRESVARSVASGQEPQLSDRAEGAVRLQVALNNAEHALGQRRIERTTEANISRDHRTLLVKHAEQLVKTSEHQKPDLARDSQLRAREIAGNVGALDLPKTANPFQEPALRTSYEHQQQEGKQRLAQQAQTAAKGKDRGGFGR